VPALPGLALLADSFRGPGFYLSPARLLLVTAAFLVWLALCAWVDRDAQEVKLPTELWNPVMIGCGILGLLVVWLLPFFFLSFVVLLALCAAPALVYVSQRNEHVEADEQVLTPRHFRALASRYLRLNLPAGGGGDDEKPIPLRFIGKSSDGREEDATRVAHAQRSRGYRAALETVYGAIQKRATDIHLEPTKDEMTVRLRIDGILQPGEPFSRERGDSVLNIFKVLAALDITEKRKPQDGSFSAEVAEAAQTPRPAKTPKGSRAGKGSSGERRRVGGIRQVDFRVATAGSVAGEKLVMRILDKSRMVTSLAQVGLRPKMREQIREVATQPHGMLIVSGPTGAGKTTTLYACLAEIDRFQKNVITVENPVEYKIDNVTQIEVNPKAGKTFASELRSILRQDPDVIYVGEIRDQETAEIACQAAQTGHMVFTTLHANDTVTAIGRLLDLGVQPFMVANAVSAVLGQRLVRLLCPECKERYKPDPEVLRKANLPADKVKVLCRAPAEEKRSGCERCGGTGYLGRTGIFELLVFTDAIRDMVRADPNLNAIRQEAVKAGMRYLQEDGLRLVLEGETSVQELMRVSK
jgi:type II secretory ATPase GspE/PulE/Tfp pilus assembly ATPase PilB-like protein